MAELTEAVVKAITKERDRQDDMWGIQRHEMGTWLKILVEEVGEVAQAMQGHERWSKQSDSENLLEEVIHVAAVATAIAEQIVEESL